MSLEFETKIPHHEWGEIKLSITDNYQPTDCPRVTISINDGGGVVGNASRVTLTIDEIEHILLIAKKYSQSKESLEVVT